MRVANREYVNAKERRLTGALDLREAGLDVRVVLVMSNSTAETDLTAANLGAITTLDRNDAAGYADQAIANQVVVRDDPNQRAEFNHDPVTWTALAASTRANIGMIYYIEGANDAARVPLFFIDTMDAGSPNTFPFTGNGTDVTFTPNAEGLAQAV